MTITGQQVKAARQLLGWSQEKLAEESGIGKPTIGKFEAGKGQPSVLTVSLIKRVLGAAGVEFVDGEPGARLKARP